MSGRSANFIMAGGGTGGHVTPALAVARALKEHGHSPIFIGTRQGLEAKLVPAGGFPIEWIDSVRMKGAGFVGIFEACRQMPASVRAALGYITQYRPAAIFSTGGFVAGPVVAAAAMKRLPLVVMEPNAMPGATNRYIGRFVAKALLSFPEAERYFPRGRTELSGVPVRREFFELTPRKPASPIAILVTGGSQGSRTLNRAMRESWALFRDAGIPVRILHQTGNVEFEDIQRGFRDAGVNGEVMPFIPDMPRAFGQADLIVSRSGAGTVAEIAAAGKPAILVPYPYAADQHQLKNAESFAKAGAALMIEDKDLTGPRLVNVIRSLTSERLTQMGEAARRFSKPNAAARAAEILEQFA